MGSNKLFGVDSIFDTFVFIIDYFAHIENG